MCRAAARARPGAVVFEWIGLKFFFRCVYNPREKVVSEIFIQRTLANLRSGSRLAHAAWRPSGQCPAHGARSVQQRCHSARGTFALGGSEAALSISHSWSWTSDFVRWLISVFVVFGISAYVCVYPSGSNTGSHPKSVGPRAGTILPGIRPSNVTTSAPGPAQKAKIVCAYADLSS